MTYYQVYPIDEHTWRIEDCFRCYMYLIEGKEKAILFDTGMGLPGLEELAKELTEKPVFVINSHGHFDHVGGNGQFGQCHISETDIPLMKDCLQPSLRKEVLDGFAKEFQMSLSEEELNALAQVKTDIVYLPLHKSEIFPIGGRTLQVIETPGHTQGSICLLDKESRMLFSADTVCDRGILLFFSHSATVAEFKQSILRLKAEQEDFDVMWPGHHKCPLDKTYLEEYLECADNILEHPEKGEPIQSNLGKGLIQYHKRISITYRQESLR